MLPSKHQVVPEPVTPWTLCLFGQQCEEKEIGDGPPRIFSDVSPSHRPQTSPRCSYTLQSFQHRTTTAVAFHRVLAAFIINSLLRHGVLHGLQVTQLVEFLIEHHEELFAEEVAGLAGTSDEESPAPELGAAAAEVPPVAPESQHLKSSSGERRLPGSSQGSRKRKGSCEEGSDGQEEEEAGAEALRDGQLRESEQVPICFCSLDSPMSSDATASTDTTRAQHHLSGGEERGAVPLCSGQQIEVTHC
ncbi:uncharacterized protein LOC113491174 [Athene cunicularia]|uniref:uncharacterized protein LOC113491174 n=1 Tax=Athene cunicularia TaxID=194338 RepID=UPI000EF738CC|nr:uncharacterized protein LOC113491174 [Athene cunicularia]